MIWRKHYADFGVEPIDFGVQYPICNEVCGRDYKVLGNIFDNPELLEVEHE